MPHSEFDFAQIERDLRSDQLRVRQLAIQRLVSRANQDPTLHKTALPIFRAALAADPDPWMVTRAAQGVTTIAGPLEGQRVWLSLLADPRPEIVTAVVFATSDRFYLPTIMELLKRRPEFSIQAAAIFALGQMQDPAALPLLLERLAHPGLRPEVIQALETLGDPRAIPAIEPFLRDTTVLAQRDERGAEIDVATVANYAISHLRGIADRRNTSG